MLRSGGGLRASLCDITTEYYHLQSQYLSQSRDCLILFRNNLGWAVYATNIFGLRKLRAIWHFPKLTCQNVICVKVPSLVDELTVQTRYKKKTITSLILASLGEQPHILHIPIRQSGVDWNRDPWTRTTMSQPGTWRENGFNRFTSTSSKLLRYGLHCLGLSLVNLN